MPPSSCETPAKKRRRESTNFQLIIESPAVDTATPTGRGFPQSLGPYCPVVKAVEKDVYHAEPMKIVPLKKKRGRPTKA